MRASLSAVVEGCMQAAVPNVLGMTQDRAVKRERADAGVTSGNDFEQQPRNLCSSNRKRCEGPPERSDQCRFVARASRLLADYLVDGTIASDYHRGLGRRFQY